MESFVIIKNKFLDTNIKGYYHQFYTGFEESDNPNFLNKLKNTFNNESRDDLIVARNEVIKILMTDLPKIIIKENIQNCLCVCVPRAKALSTYSESQLMFKEAVRIAANNISGVIDGTESIIRVENTRTTHLRNARFIENDGADPYPGITVDTCRIDKNRVRNQDIILIDDIYTKNVNVDEDCIQALLDSGAKRVIFYAIAYTRRNR